MLTLTVVAFALPAAAQEEEKPWTPKEYPRSELIDFGTFDRSPLKLPWSVKRTEQVASHGNVNFKHIVEASHSEIEKHFEDAYGKESTVLELKPFAVPKGTSRKLKCIGTATQGDVRRFTLGNSDLRRRFVVELTREGGETVLLFKNVAYSMLFGAGVPRRAPFRPADVDPIPFPH